MDFSKEERFDFQAMIDEAIETITSANLELGPGEKVPEPQLQETVKPLQRLRETQAFFASELTVIPLGVQDFKARGISPSAEIDRWMENHRFYLVQIPITLMPAEGWTFTKLKCWIGFKNRDGDGIPKAHDIFPENEWAEILQAKMHMKVGLDENLKFKAGARPPEIATESADLQMQGKVQGTVDGGFHCVAGPFDYHVYREITISRGRENSEVFWRLNGHEHIEREEPYLAVVLRVPKSVRTINASGALIAHSEFNYGGADFSSWLGQFRKKVRSFFEKEMPLDDTREWSDITKGLGEADRETA